MEMDLETISFHGDTSAAMAYVRMQIQPHRCKPYVGAALDHIVVLSSSKTFLYSVHVGRELRGTSTAQKLSVRTAIVLSTLCSTHFSSPPSWHHLRSGIWIDTNVKLVRTY